MMISPPPSPTFARILGRRLAKDENPPPSPKRFVARDQLSHFGLKRRHVHSDTQPTKRVPLDPLSASDLDNRRNRLSQSTNFVASHHPSDFPALLPEQSVSSGYRGILSSSTASAKICSWPPPAPALDPATTDEPSPSCAAFLDTTRRAPDSFETEHTAATAKPMRSTGWKSENVLQPIRSRTNTMPTVRRPPGELWQSDTGLTNADYEPTTPPGLPPPQARSELRRNGSLSLSLAKDSQPLRASDHTKAVPPIGAERSRVISTFLTSHAQSLAAPSSAPSPSPWSSSSLSPRLQAKWKNDVYLLDTTSLEKVQAVAGDSNMSREDLERLLRHAVRNKHAPKIISPLSPLRSATSVFDLSTDPEYQLRMPSQVNNPSPRYCNSPVKRARIVCDRYQSFDWDTTCMHCQECKRDALRKRLLALHYRQCQTYHIQHSKFLAFPSRGETPSVMDDDRIVLANRMREAFAYEVDDEEKSLWAEVAAVTGAGPQPFSFSRAAVPCAAATHQSLVDGNGDGYDNYLDNLDEGLLTNPSAALFHGITVY